MAGKGQLLFNNACRTCHTLRQGDNRLGPHLNRIIGRKMGALPDYGYSSAMKRGDLVWDRSTLDRFLAEPDRVVPGNTMKPSGGVSSATAIGRRSWYFADCELLQDSFPTDGSCSEWVMSAV